MIKSHCLSGKFRRYCSNAEKRWDLFIVTTLLGREGILASSLFTPLGGRKKSGGDEETRRERLCGEWRLGPRREEGQSPSGGGDGGVRHGKEQERVNAGQDRRKGGKINMRKNRKMTWLSSREI
ncbi:hypothetical protein SKAU_G00309850 [Synaphobranchus kaupii]|uniref:Uncharacterized protein n=1 Tax=Synaphobranchus kaupii TaxID=118154 RepID=A0A9Q1ERE5_SYNKA|nr:hypothetical protein SKAU_G00309850 [Synaphobranchus kaupii]